MQGLHLQKEADIMTLLLTKILLHLLWNTTWIQDTVDSFKRNLFENIINQIHFLSLYDLFIVKHS